jgi:pilus assembly protein Flp/PilA
LEAARSLALALPLWIKTSYSLMSTVNPEEVTITMIKRFFAEEEGQTLVEYGLLISLIALVVIAVLTVMGKRISNTFNAAGNQMTN